VINFLVSLGKWSLELVVLYAVLANVLVYVYASAGVQPPPFLTLYPAVQLKAVAQELNSTVPVGNTTVSGVAVGQVYQGWQVVTYSVNAFALVLNFLMQMAVGLPILFYELAKAANEALGSPLGPAIMYIAAGVGAMLQSMAIFYIAYTLAGSLRQYL